MKYPLFSLASSCLLLAACVSQTNVPANPQGMMHGGQGMMGGSQQNNENQGMMNHGGGATFLPGEGKDLSVLPEVQTSQVVEIKDGDMIMLKPILVRKTINGKSFGMYGYNGEIPGPLLKVKQGSTFTVDVQNGIDLPTSIHWHGIRVANASDGAVGMTQEEIKPGGSFRYTIHVPDEGMYWYHPHVREDIQQDMGLYGNILVTSADNKTYAPVNREEVLMLDDLLLKDGLPVPYGRDQADFTLMGRFGNTFLVNGDPSYTLNAKRGEIVRLFLTNAANTRTYRIGIPGAKMKLVGGDSGRYERETFVDAVTLAPSERAIVDVLFEKAGRFSIENRNPTQTQPLGTVIVAQDASSPSYAKAFSILRTNADVSASIEPFRASFDKTPDHTLVLDMTMMGGRMDSTGSPQVMGGNSMMGGIPPDGIEWEGSGVNQMGMMGNMMQWKMIDQPTGAANKDLTYTAKVGDKLKIRIINKKDSPHPMQHPIHFHGQRFLVLSENGVKNTNLIWKDTVLVPAGHTVDILLDVSNAGDWMFHCHIAEHLSNGMMGQFKVLP